jgi:hypothetical protein
MLRLLLAAGLFLGITLVGSACDDECNIFVGPCAPSCPASFTEGDACEWENQQCVFSTGACREIEAKRTVCTCANQSGGFRWDCAIKFCSCTCPCGVLATASCDALDCADAEDACPANAMPFCEQHCADGGLRDAGADGRVDAGTDAVKPDAAKPDAAKADAAKADAAKRDAAKPDAAKPDAGKDAAADGPADAATH